MTEARRLAYLEALEIPVWVPRSHTDRAPDMAPAMSSEAAASPCLAVTAGGSGLLLICRSQREAGSRLARDIGRSVRLQPGWAWPQEPGSATSLAEAVEEHLFTGVLIFGQALADALLGAQRPDRIGQARVWVVDGLDLLQESAAARSKLWRFLCDKRLAAMA